MKTVEMLAKELKQTKYNILYLRRKYNIGITKKIIINKRKLEKILFNKNEVELMSLYFLAVKNYKKYKNLLDRTAMIKNEVVKKLEDIKKNKELDK